MAFTTIGGPVASSEERAPTWKPKPGDVLTGVVASRRVSVKTKYGPCDLIVIDDDDQGRVAIWIKSALREWFDNTRVYDRVQVTYRGKKAGSNGFSYDMFDAAIDYEERQ